MQLVITLFCFLWTRLLLANRKIELLVYMMFLSSPIIVLFRFPIEMPIKRWIVFSLFLYWLINKRRDFGCKFPFLVKTGLSIMFLGSFLLIFFDSRFSFVNRLLYPILDAFNIYIALFFSYYFVRNRGSLSRMFKPVLVSSLIISIYAIFNFVTHENPIVNFLISLYNSNSETFDILLNQGWDDIRKGVMSIYRYTFDFGYNSGLFFLLLVYYLLEKMRISKKHVLCLVLSFGGLFLCASRTILIAFIISTLVFFLFSKDGASRKRKLFFLAIILFSVAYCFIPVVNNMIQLTIQSIFLQTGDLEKGSSISMREGQLEGALAFWSKNPIWGNGYKYIFLDLGFGQGKRIEGMAGYESIIYGLLIERGAIGIVVYLLFFLCVYAYYLRNLKYDRQLCALGISCLTAFIICAIGTGPLDSWLNTMILQGVFIKNIEIAKLRYKESKLWIYQS